MCEYTEKSVMLRSCAGEGPGSECRGMTGRDQRGGGAIEKKAEPES